MKLKDTLLRSVFAGSVLFVAYPVAAQTNEQLQQQIQQLQQQLKNLQNQVNEQSRQAPAAAPAAAAPAPAGGVKVTLSPANRPGISSADGQNTIELTSRLHLDFADYLSVHPQTPNGQHSLESGVNARRARLGVLGKFMGDWNYAFILDFGGSSDSNSAAGARNSDIENAFISYNGFRPFAIDLGYLDVPFTLDESTSSNDIMFIERASSNVVATGLAANDARAAAGVRWNNDRTFAGAYLTGPTSGALHSGSSSQQLGSTVRATYQVLQSNNYSLHAGVDGEYVIIPRNDGSSSTSVAKAVSFSERPELRVDPTAFLNTGTIPAKDAYVGGGELAGGIGSFFAQGEYYRYYVDQKGLSATAPTPQLEFEGYYAQASYIVTGESRKYIPTTGAYSGVRPDRPVGSGGWGAWEVAARYSYLNLNSHATPGVSPLVTGGVFGGNQTTYVFGINWYPITNIRFMLDYIYADVHKIPIATAGGTTQPGAKIQAIAMRTQVAF